MMITLYLSGTPNGHKISIMLEELGCEYQVRRVHLSKMEQKTPEFLALNPNGRIPVIVDHDNDDFPVFESGAILIYLAEKYQQFLPKDLKTRSQVIQWLFFQTSGIGPMQGQAHVFYRYAPEKIPYAISRYQNETRRLYEVLNTRLKGRDYLVDEYSIADMASYPWVKVHDWAGVSLEGLDNLQAWLERIDQRTAVQKGLNIPTPYEHPSESVRASGKLTGNIILGPADEK